MANYFPEEIWYQILQRLPSKSLCRFLAVSKPWCRLITSRKFISSHLNQTLLTETNTHVFLSVNHYTPNNFVPEEEFLFYPNHTCKGEDSKSLGVPSFVASLPCFLMHQQIIGSCNGVICLTGPPRTDTLTLFNPSIHKVVILPPYNIKFPKNCWHVFGFGVNPLNGEFKLVRAVRERVTSSTKVLAEVYSFETGKWVEINGFDGSNIEHDLCMCQVYLHGRSHWIDNSVRSLISFDMGDETFREVSVPHILPYEFDFIHRRLATLSVGEKECITIIIDESHGYTIWVMTEYGDSESWNNMYFVDMRPTPQLNFAGFLKNGYLLMSGKPKLLTRHDLHSDSALDLQYSMVGSRVLSGRITKSVVVHADKYIESLALVEPLFTNITSI